MPYTHTEALQDYNSGTDLWNKTQWIDASHKYKKFLTHTPEDLNALKLCALAAWATSPVKTSTQENKDNNTKDWTYISETTASIINSPSTLPISFPSDYWAFFGNIHMRMLADFGVDHFKRTVSHNYYNWLIHNATDPIFINLTERWAYAGQLTGLRTTAEPPGQTGWDNYGLPYPLANLGQLEIYRLFVSMAWDVALAMDPWRVLDQLEESPIGTPVDIWRDGKRISTDLAAGALERAALLAHGGLDPDDASITVVELGAGQGRLAEVLLQTTRWRHVIVDIPPALSVASWYLPRRFPDEKIFAWRPFDDFAEVKEELDAARLVLLSADQIRHLPNDYADAFVNIASLMEMTPEQVAFYLSEIHRLTRRVFFSKQWRDRENPTNQTHFDRSTYALPAPWRVAHHEDDPLIAGLFVDIWLRD